MQEDGFRLLMLQTLDWSGTLLDYEVIAYVAGEWAVHRPMPDEDLVSGWLVTHVPSSGRAFFANTYEEAKRVAHRLKQYAPPLRVKTVNKMGEVPRLSGVTSAWIREVARILEGYNVQVLTTGSSLVSLEQIVELYEQHEARQFT